MPKVIEVIYEDGVFKPLEKVELKEGKKVRIEIKENLVERLKRYRTKVDRDVLKEFTEERR
ncbi:antitoxin [Archaeoglobales archaeon]|nr:MAG: antitoxin [Archaeoglobales archaeon]